MTVAVGIDVGGTQTKAAVVTDHGQVLHELTEPTARDLPSSEVPAFVAGLIARLLAAADVSPADLAGACVGLPGVVEPRMGLAFSCPNLRAWENVPLGPLASDLAGARVLVERDASLAVLGEAWQGAARGARHAICFTLGTGVGAGILADGRLFHGAWGGAGEIGHIIVARDGPRCSCGNRGCLEALASASAIAREGRQAADRAPDSALWDLAGGTRDAITAEVVFQAAARGDTTARRVVDTAMEYLGLGVASALNAFNPEVVVLGGGMAAAGEQILQPVRQVVQMRAREPLAARVRIELAQLGMQAGMLGGARAVFLAGIG
jgi:glucokinase